MKISKKDREKLIVALDFHDLKSVRSMLTELRGTVCHYKIGLELFTTFGWKAVELVKKENARVFLDLKLHDIPNTVGRTVSTLARHGVEMTNIHGLGGLEMMKAAAKAVKELPKSKRPQLIAVTILTSHDQKTLNQDIKVSGSIASQVKHLAGLAKKAGLDGVVCSPLENKMLKSKFKSGFITVTPGVRPAGAAVGDQKRVYTPTRAIQEGSNYIVVGRPITQAKDPLAAAESILQEIKNA